MAVMAEPSMLHQMNQGKNTTGFQRSGRWGTHENTDESHAAFWKRHEFRKPPANQPPLSRRGMNLENSGEPTTQEKHSYYYRC
jgi:hypothetical protein